MSLKGFFNTPTALESFLKLSLAMCNDRRCYQPKKRKRAIFFAAEETYSAWKPLSSHQSPQFTTQWKELLTIRL
jgi:hypothetical protein